MTDKIAAAAKYKVTRKTNQLAGARISLPGHHHLREESLRAEIVSDFGPTNRVEMIWVGDIAYCMAGIELRRAQIAAFHHRMLRKTYEKISKTNSLHIPGDGATPSLFDGVDFPVEHRAEMAAYATLGFQAPWPETLLEREAFSLLLGSLEPRDTAALRMLEQAMYDQMRERDRIINQIDRRRRDAMRAAIEQAEARQRAWVAERAEAKTSDIEIKRVEIGGESQDKVATTGDNALEADSSGLEKSRARSAATMNVQGHSALGGAAVEPAA